MSQVWTGRSIFYLHFKLRPALKQLRTWEGFMVWARRWISVAKKSLVGCGPVFAPYIAISFFTLCYVLPTWGHISDSRSCNIMQLQLPTLAGCPGKLGCWMVCADAWSCPKYNSQPEARTRGGFGVAFCGIWATRFQGHHVDTWHCLIALVD